MEALKSPAVNLPALAMRVEAAHFPDAMATSDVVAETPGMSLSAIPLILLVMSLSSQSQSLLPTLLMLIRMKSSQIYPLNGVLQLVRVNITAMYTCPLLHTWL